MKYKISSYGIKKKFQIKHNLDVYVEEINRTGFTVIKDVFDARFIKKISDEIDEIDIKHRNLDFLLDEDIIRCPLIYSNNIFKIATNQKIMSLIKKILGQNFVLLMQNAIINKSNKSNYQIKWHRDLNYQHWTSSEILAVNFLVCIDPFFDRGGCTYALPCSHMFEDFPSDIFIKNNEVPIEANAGDVILMNAMTYHRSGQNITENFTRRAINHVVGLPFMSQQISIPKLLKNYGQDYSSDSFLQKYLGYKWNPTDDINSWFNLRR